MSFTDTGMTEFDMTEKDTTPIDGFPHYGIVKEDYVSMKGCSVGPKKRILTLSQSLLKQNSCFTPVKIKLKFIDTSSKFGHGRFQDHPGEAEVLWKGQGVGLYGHWKIMYIESISWERDHERKSKR